MLNLTTRLTINNDLMKAANLTDRFSEEDLTALGEWVWRGYNQDRQSRDKWEKRTQAAMDLALQLSKDKNFPWPGCSNVAFPLVTIATLQFHSRAYPAIIQGTSIVKYRVVGEDPQGTERLRAERIGGHMSYQLLEEDISWEEQHDRLLINIPIVGSAFKKSYFDAEGRHNRSELVLAADFVLDYFAKSVEDCMRKTHIIPLFRNDLHTNIMLGVFRDVRQEKWYDQPAPINQTRTDTRADARQGQTPPQSDEDTPFRTLEQHCWLDLDGDGYKEPYIVTIEETSHCVLRIVARFERSDDISRNSRGEIIKIKPTEYFTKYEFLPSPDGGIYGIGFGVLLGPLNEAVNSIVNQLIDAGTMANTAGGFLGRGAKIRGGVYTFAPLEWKRVDSTVDDLHKSIFPLPVREPSAVLFQLLALLIEYTGRISGTTETMVGENPGQNTPAQTTQTLVEQGGKIFNAIFKRVWRSMKEEFKKLYILNAVYMPDKVSYGTGKEGLKDDYLGNPDRIAPVADPNVLSDTARFQRALAVKQAAMTTPGYDIPTVERNYLHALQIDGVDTLYPGPDKVPPLPNPKVQVEQIKLQGKQMDIQLRQAELKLDQQRYAMDLIEEQRLNTAKIHQLEAQAAKLIAEAGGVRAGHEIAAFEAAIGALKEHNNGLKIRADALMKSMETGDETTNRGGMEGLAGAPGNQGPAGPAGGSEGAV